MVGIPVPSSLLGADTPTLDVLVRELPTVGALTVVALTALYLVYRAIVALERHADREREKPRDPDES